MQKKVPQKFNTEPESSVLHSLESDPNDYILGEEEKCIDDLQIH